MVELVNTMLITETASSPTLNLTNIRAQFPSLSQLVNGHLAVFLDGPAGTQIPHAYSPRRHLPNRSQLHFPALMV